MSADHSCQNLKNRKHAQLSYLYKTERRGECARQRRDRERERESVCEGAQIAANRGSIGCKNSHWKNGPFGKSQD